MPVPVPVPVQVQVWRQAREQGLELELVRVQELELVRVRVQQILQRPFQLPPTPLVLPPLLPLTEQCLPLQLVQQLHQGQSQDRQPTPLQWPCDLFHVRARHELPWPPQ